LSANECKYPNLSTDHWQLITASYSFLCSSHKKRLDRASIPRIAFVKSSTAW